MRAPLVAVLLALAGCVTHATRMNRLWDGRDIREAISELGPPEQVTPNGLTTLYMWTTSSSVKSTGGVWHGFSAQKSTLRTCEAWFVVETSTGEIIRWRERGEDC